MTAPLASAGLLAAGPHRLEYRRWGPAPGEAPTLVLLHEGLGSVGLWGAFPERLAAATGLGVLAYSRPGYGASSPASLPRRPSYMHDEALEVLPGLLDAIGFRRGVLVGHSDGASIAAIYAGSVADDRVAGLSLIAPHFIVEDVTIDGIAAARRDYETGTLRQKLARWHEDVDATFRGWNDGWLNPAFRDWDIRDRLPGMSVPIQVIQGDADRYGTLRQVEIAREHCGCPVEATVLPGIGHSPHREAPDATLDAVAGFVARVLPGQGRVSRFE